MLFKTLEEKEMNLAAIPSDYWLSLKNLRERGFSGSELKLAAQDGGLLQRKRNPKTRRVYYKSRNYCLNLQE